MSSVTFQGLPFKVTSDENTNSSEMTLVPSSMFNASNMITDSARNQYTLKIIVRTKNIQLITLSQKISWAWYGFLHSNKPKDLLCIAVQIAGIACGILFTNYWLKACHFKYQEMKKLAETGKFVVKNQHGFVIRKASAIDLFLQKTFIGASSLLVGLALLLFFAALILFLVMNIKDLKLTPELDQISYRLVKKEKQSSETSTTIQ